MKKSLQLEPEKRALFDPPTALPSAIHLPTSAYEEAKKAAPGWDVYELERQWREWMKGQTAPTNPAGAFVCFCKGKPANRRRM